jgi:hypothetical protein
MATQREVPLSLSIDRRGCHHFATCATEQKAVKPGATKRHTHDRLRQFRQ